MRNFLVYLIILISYENIYAQQTEHPPPFSLSVARLDFDIEEGFQLSINIGATVTQTFKTPQILLTPGNIQVLLRPCVEGNFSYYPNPVERFITIRYEGCLERVFKIQLFNTTGYLVSEFKPDNEGLIDLGEVPAGLYACRIFLSNGEINQIKILKTNRL